MPHFFVRICSVPDVVLAFENSNLSKARPKTHGVQSPLGEPLPKDGQPDRKVTTNKQTRQTEDVHRTNHEPI